MAEQRWCEDCAGGAERCARTGDHDLEVLTILCTPTTRVYRCKRCKARVDVPICEGCGKDLVPPRIPAPAVQA